jgi:hypothetical protein
VIRIKWKFECSDQNQMKIWMQWSESNGNLNAVIRIKWKFECSDQNQMKIWMQWSESNENLNVVIRIKWKFECSDQNQIFEFLYIHVYEIFCFYLELQSNLTYMYVTFQWKSEIWSHKTGGHLYRFNWYEMHCEGK